MLASRLFSPGLVLSVLPFAVAPLSLAQATTQNVTVPAGVPLRIAVDHQIAISRPGTPVTARVTAPVYVRDRMVIPAGAQAVCTITAIHAAPRQEHVRMLMRADFTPPHAAEIHVDKLVMPDGQELAVHTAAASPSGLPVRMATASRQKRSLWNMVKSTFQEKKESTLGQVTAPDKMQRVKDALWLSLPYHPQWIAAGTPLDADLAAPVVLSLPAQPPANLDQVGAPLPPKTEVHARLLTGLTSAVDKQGAPVEAVLTDPVFDAQHRLLFPEGTTLSGSVLRAKPAKWFGRNGQLRFTFKSISLPGDVSRPVHGQMTATEGNPAAHLKVDDEGGAEAQPAGNRYLAPIALALLATQAVHDDDGSGNGPSFIAGGTGLAGRLLVLAANSKPVSAGFAYYSLTESVGKRWIAPGQNVVFPKDTRMEIEIGAR